MRSSARSNVREDTSSACCTPQVRAIPISCACVRATLEGAPDAVVYPSSHDQLRALLELCARASLAVVPFGGGTSVVGGVAPLRGSHSGVLALDMGRMAALLDLDRESATVSVQAGIRAPALERELARRGSHAWATFPQSFEYVSLGGCAATRSAGQASTGYGAIEKLVLGPARGQRPRPTSSCQRCLQAPPAPACVSYWSALRGRWA